MTIPKHFQSGYQMIDGLGMELDRINEVDLDIVSVVVDTVSPAHDAHGNGFRWSLGHVLMRPRRTFLYGGIRSHMVRCASWYDLANLGTAVRMVVPGGLTTRDAFLLGVGVEMVTCGA